VSARKVEYHHEDAGVEIKSVENASLIWAHIDDCHRFIKLGYLASVAAV